MNKYALNTYIQAIMWSYGFTRSKAYAYYRKYKMEGNINTLNLLVEGFQQNAKQSFYEDQKGKRNGNSTD